MLLIKEYEDDVFKVCIWEKEPEEIGPEFEISIENDEMDNITFDIETLNMVIKHLQSARDYVLNKHK